MRPLQKKNERYRKIVAKCKEKNTKILGQKNKLVSSMASMTKSSEKLQKKKMKVHHTENKSKISTKLELYKRIWPKRSAITSWWI